MSDESKARILHHDKATGIIVTTGGPENCSGRNLETQKRNSVQFRGRFLDEMSGVEYCLDLLLAASFGTKREDQITFHRLILQQMPLSRKREVLVGLIEAQRVPQLIPMPKMLEDLRSAIELRNKLAHWYTVLPDEAFSELLPEDELQLVTYKQAREDRYRIAGTEFEAMLESARQVRYWLFSLLGLQRQARGAERLYFEERRDLGPSPVREDRK